jgi:PAS domain S-box-containing protein
LATDYSNDKPDFEHLADSLPQIIWTARPDGFLDYYNERWYEFTGYDRGQGGDQSWLPLLHPDDIERAKAAWYHSVKTGEDFNLELRFHDRRAGKYIWILGNARAVRNTNGEIIKWYGSCTNIENQKKAEQQVVDILEGMNDSFFAIDADWNLSRINSKMEATTHINREDSVGKNFFLSFPIEKDSKYWINHHKIMEERVRVQYEEYYAPLDLWTEARGYPTADGGIAYLFRDITTEKKALQKLEVLAQELQEAVNIRDEFLSIASHELRTPVTSLKLQLQMLRRLFDPLKVDALPIEKIVRMIDSSNLKVNRLSSLIEGLLDITRMDDGKMSYQFQDVNISDLVSEVVERFSEDFLRSNSKLKLVAQTDLHIECDPLRIEQVLVNLLSNALKYGSDNEVIVTLEKASLGVSLGVQDGGMGIPVDKQERIFNRFERLIPHTNISGMGLGLYIAKQIVEAHRGLIFVESEVGVGSRFLVELPTKV